nr:hsp90 co-chaperone Cdc37-like 1 [Pogona vitticeps]
MQIYNDGIELACQQQKEFVKNSVECKWNLAEAQQKLGSLALHNSESLDQEHAKAQAEVAELRWREEEWRRKEEALRQKERQDLWNTDVCSKEVFNKKGALMEQVAHQAVVMQFIIEMAKSCNVDPRGCFRLFFQKAKTGEEGYLDAFKNELEAFKTRVRICSQSQKFQAMPVQKPLFHTDNSIGGLASFPQNADLLQGCSLNSVVHREEEEPKMMDTV